MKREIEDFLRQDGNWKSFANEEQDMLKEAELVDVDVITMEQEKQRIFFDVSIIYKLHDENQKQVLESGVAILGERGDIQSATSNKLS